MYPYFRAISSGQDTEVVIKGQRLIMIGSNNYLGLTNHPEIKEAAKVFAGQYKLVEDHKYILPGTDHRRRLLVYERL